LVSALTAAPFSNSILMPGILQLWLSKLQQVAGLLLLLLCCSATRQPALLVGLLSGVPLGRQLGKGLKLWQQYCRGKEHNLLLARLLIPAEGCLPQGG
jgi:hypothetical protein